MSPEEAIRLSRCVAGDVGRGLCEDDIDDLAAAALLRYQTEKFDPSFGGDETGFVLQRMRWAALREAQRMRRRQVVRVEDFSENEQRWAPGMVAAGPWTSPEEVVDGSCAHLVADIAGTLSPLAVLTLHELASDPDVTTAEISRRIGRSPARVTRYRREIRAAARFSQEGGAS